MLLSSSSQNVRNSSVDWSSPTIVPSKSDTTKIGWFLLRIVSVVVVANWEECARTQHEELLLG